MISFNGLSFEVLIWLLIHKKSQSRIFFLVILWSSLLLWNIKFSLRCKSVTLTFHCTLLSGANFQDFFWGLTIHVVSSFLKGELTCNLLLIVWVYMFIMLIFFVVGPRFLRQQNRLTLNMSLNGYDFASIILGFWL